MSGLSSSSCGTLCEGERPLTLRFRIPDVSLLERNTHSLVDPASDFKNKMIDSVTQFFEKHHFTFINLDNIDLRFLKNLYAVSTSQSEDLQAMVIHHMLFAHEGAPAVEQQLSLLVEILTLSFNKLSSHIDQLRREQAKTITILRNDVFILNQQLRIANRQSLRRATSEALVLLASSDEENVPCSPVKKPRVDSGDGTIMSPPVVCPQIFAI
jgi:hypothetical protein